MLPTNSDRRAYMILNTGNHIQKVGLRIYASRNKEGENNECVIKQTKWDKFLKPFGRFDLVATMDRGWLAITAARKLKGKLAVNELNYISLVTLFL